MRVVKADAKGRITGFEPGEEYHIYDSEGSRKVDLSPESLAELASVSEKRVPTMRDWKLIEGRDFKPENIGQTVGIAFPGGAEVWGRLESYYVDKGEDVVVRLKGNPSPYLQSDLGEYKVWVQR